MMYCELCGNKIETQKINENFVITLGNIKDSQFIAGEKIAVHKECGINKTKFPNQDFNSIIELKT
ncbi:MAG: hypothetical protein GF317_21995 [Candidatus Lokiarchaeota archaeon]|nr:hypothetical protein [Candidatus Lokiarchaeota archaeon]MBD3202132.1 hypothetical protein [Candidatus Lokiarchaeota archaeon]